MPAPSKQQQIAEAAHRARQAHPRGRGDEMREQIAAQFRTTRAAAAAVDADDIEVVFGPSGWTFKEKEK